MTRIVAGVARGRRLAVPPRGTRPTSDRVREALFSALDAVVGLDGTTVLDLYAGTGALGLEALSRGAAAAVLVESDRTALGVLRGNVTTVGLPGATVLPGRVATVLAQSTPVRCDVVLADPPYAATDDELGAVLTGLVEHGWLAPDATVVLERPAKVGPPRWPAALEPGAVRRYGDTALHWADHRPAVIDH